MKKQPSEQPRIRVVDEEAATDEVVRLGDDEEVVRLGDERPAGKSPGRAVVAKRLEVSADSAPEARTATVEEILDAAGDPAQAAELLEDAWGGEAKRSLRVPWGWFVLILLLLAGLVGWSLRQMFVNRHVTQLAISRTIELVADDAERQAEALELYRTIENRIRGYLASGTVEDLERHVRDPQRVVPLMRNWYRRQPLESHEYLEMATFQPLTIERRPFWVVTVSTDAGPRPLLLEQRGDDVAVDWETDVCYQPMAWGAFVSERPAGEHDFRVRVALDNYYAHGFHDESRYRCLRLTAKGSDQHLFGYVERGSALEREVLRAVRTTGHLVPMILRLRCVPDSKGRRAVEVLEVVSERWCVVGDRPG
jgi:hypothetical protein